MKDLEKAIRGGKRDYMRKPQVWAQIVPNGEAYTYVKDKRVRVSDVDLPLVRKYRWYLHNGYVLTSIKYKRVKMHRLILGDALKKEDEVDHKNRNRLDNRRSNLRIASRLLNAHNVRGKGYRKRGKVWEAYLCIHYRQYSLGSYKTEAEAKSVRDKLKDRLIDHLAAGGDLESFFEKL